MNKGEASISPVFPTLGCAPHKSAFNWDGHPFMENAKVLSACQALCPQVTSVQTDAFS